MLWRNITEWQSDRGLYMTSLIWRGRRRWVLSRSSVDWLLTRGAGAGNWNILELRGGLRQAGEQTNQPSLSLSLRTESRHPLRPAAATPRSEGRQCQVETTGMIKTGKNCWGGIDCCFVEERWRGTPGGAKVCWFLTRLRTEPSIPWLLLSLCAWH